MTHPSLPEKRRNRRVLLLAGLAAAIIGGAGCEPGDQKGSPSSAPATPSAARSDVAGWQPIFRGVELREASATEPRPLAIRAVRIDLHEPTIRFLVTPSNGDAPKDTGARSASEFLTEFGCQIAVNGSFFSPFAEARGDPQDVIGLSLSRGDLYSPPNKWDALLISEDRRVWIDPSPVEPDGAYNGLSGHRMVLDDGEITADPNETGNMARTHPRTAAGVTEDERYLILMTIDGRQLGYSEGVTLVETGEWLRKLGAWDGINLDGGGSTTLVIEGEDGEPQLINRPSGKLERRVANHLGVFAKPLAGVN